jgi:hypothetical protein
LELNGIMLKLLDTHMDVLLISALGGFFLFGVGYMVTQDLIRDQDRYNTCIEAGKQYISGSCVE